MLRNSGTVQYIKLVMKSMHEFCQSTLLVPKVRIKDRMYLAPLMLLAALASFKCLSIVICRQSYWLPENLPPICMWPAVANALQKLDPKAPDLKFLSYFHHLLVQTWVNLLWCVNFVSNLPAPDLRDYRTTPVDINSPKFDSTFLEQLWQHVRMWEDVVWDDLHLIQIWFGNVLASLGPWNFQVLTMPCMSLVSHLWSVYQITASN